MKVLVSDTISAQGLDILKSEKEIQVDVKTGLSGDELKKIIKDYEGIVIRSSTHLTKDILSAAIKLKVIGRAGVGVDNVDLSEATKRGVIVMNTPEGNTISTCEHTFAMLLAMSRSIPQANQSLKVNKEWNRNKFVGVEVYGKTLGVVGFGRIGREVARRAQAFGMKVITFDPFISKDAVGKMDVEFVTIKELCQRADYITVHTPLTDETKYIIDKKEFEVMKKDVMILNCARGGIIQESALMEALKSGKVRAAALDVFEKEPAIGNPLLGLDNVVATPHLGAATIEAQENVATAVVKQVCDALLNRGVKNAVNLPDMDPRTQKELGPWIILAERLGRFSMQMLGGSLSRIHIRYAGKVTDYSLQPLTLSVVKGILAPVMGETVNYVNAPFLAKERGIEVMESKTNANEDFTNFIEVELTGDQKKLTVLGTLFGEKDSRIVRVNQFYLDAHPKGWMIAITNKDMPGFVGQVGTVLGQHHINIAEMTLGRDMAGGQALTVINTDQQITEAVCEAIRKIPQVVDLKVVKL
jgi:D-3-phosphoglycerate dehydrogenase